MNLGRCLALPVAAMLLVAACASGDGDEPTATTSPIATPPPATEAPTSEPQREVVELGYAAEPVFPHVNFERMLGLYEIPGPSDHAVAVSQDGRIRTVNLAEPSEEPRMFLDLSDRLISDPRTEEGLLGLAFDPDFGSNGYVYVNYTASEPRRNVISRFTTNGSVADPGSETVVLEIEQPFANHNGGQLAFGPDGYLYITSGDGGSGGDPLGNGQSTNTLLGKILRIDVSSLPYTVPDDNPFAQGGGRAEIWAYGLRNPWRASFDAETGDLWAGDVGQNEWEEVDRIERGGNYGWNIMEGPECFGAESCDMSGFIMPRAWYPTADGCAVTGGFVYRGERLPELDGWYVYADYCSGAVWALDTADRTREPVLLAETGLQLPSFAVVDGELYLVTFNNAIYQLRRAS